MPDPTGRWVNKQQWQCPRCAWVNHSEDEVCQQCTASIRPSEQEPIRAVGPLDLIGREESRSGDAGPVELTTRAIHRLTRVTREKAMALFGQSLRTVLKGHGDRALQAITEMPEGDQQAALGSLVDSLETDGFALYRIEDDTRE